MPIQLELDTLYLEFDPYWLAVFDEYQDTPITELHEFLQEVSFGVGQLDCKRRFMVCQVLCH
ncbi:MAG: hypothetical protein Q7J73_01960, partial [Dehalococcoidales bacterium]|nr:hypothetical protein [Dehalococcoidales bacterium]